MAARPGAPLVLLLGRTNRSSWRGGSRSSPSTPTCSGPEEPGASAWRTFMRPRWNDHRRVRAGHGGRPAITGIGWMRQAMSPADLARIRSLARPPPRSRSRAAARAASRWSQPHGTDSTEIVAVTWRSGPDPATTIAGCRRSSARSSSTSQRPDVPGSGRHGRPELTADSTPHRGDHEACAAPRGCPTIS